MIPPMRGILRCLLASILLLALLLAPMAHACVMADNAVGGISGAADAGNGPADDDAGKITHNCGHCQGHQTASIDTVLTVVPVRQVAIALWPSHDVRPDHIRPAPLPKPPKA